MTAHEARLVDIAVDANDAALAGVLPHGDVALVGQHGLFVGVHGYHELVVVDEAHEVLIVEVAEGIDEGLLVVGALNELEEGQQRVAELLIGQSGIGLNVDHGYQVLLAGQTLGTEIVQLLHQGRLGAEEVVGAYLQTVAVGEVDVALEVGVDAVAALGGLQIDVGHLGVLADGLPEHLALVVREVDAVDVGAGVLALQIGVLGLRLSQCRQVERAATRAARIYFFMPIVILRVQSYCKLSKKAYLCTKILR